MVYDAIYIKHSKVIILFKGLTLDLPNAYFRLT